MRLNNVRIEDDKGRVRLVGEIARADGERLPDLWFEYPDEYAPFVRADADVFMPLLLCGSMMEGGALSTEMPVSAKLAREFPDIQAVFSLWFPDAMRVVETRLPNVVAKEPNDFEAAGACFSAGVDAYYTVMAEKEGIRRDVAPLTHLVYMLGLEAPLPKMAGDKTERVRQIAEHLGYPLIVGRTNARDIFDQTYITFVAGPALVGVGLSLSRGLSAFRIPAGSSYRVDEMRPGVGQQYVAPKNSTEYMYVTRDGAEARRVDKVEFLAKYPYVLENLSVCIENLGVWDNCGKCPKCIRTMTALQALGALEKTPGFPSPFDYDLVKRVNLDNFVEHYSMLANLELACREGRDPRLVRILERRLWRHHRYRALVGLVEETPLHPVARALRAIAKRLFRR